MTPTQAELLMRERLAGMDGLPATVWPNEDEMPAPPFFIVDFIRVEGQRLGHGDTHRTPARMQVTVATRPGRGTQEESYPLAEAVAARFPTDLPLGADSEVRITQRPAILEGYQDGTLWRVPVQVRYEFID